VLMSDIQEILKAISEGNLAEVKVQVEQSSSKTLIDPANQRTLLHHAVVLNQNEISKFLLSYSLNPNAQDDQGLTALHIAPTREIAELLLHWGADPSIRDHSDRLATQTVKDSQVLNLLEHFTFADGEELEPGAESNFSPSRFESGSFNESDFFAAAERGNLSVIQICLSKGQDLFARDETGQSLLHYVAKVTSAKELVDFLVDGGLDVNAKDDSGQTPLHIAALWSNRAGAEALLSRNADPNVHDRSHIAPLHHGVRLSLQITQLLLANGANVDLQDEQGRTALHIEALAGNADGVQMLLENNAASNIQDSLGQTPLHLSAKRGHLNVVKLLLDFGADWNLQDNAGQVAMHFAASSHSKEVITLLLDKGASLNVSDTMGISPLHIAAKLDLTTIELLVSKGANIHQQDQSGREPVHYSAAQYAPSLVRFFLDHSVNVNVQDSFGLTPLHFAILTGHLGVVQFLLDQGADGNLPTHNGLTAVHFAAMSGNPELVNLLFLRGFRGDINIDPPIQTPLHFAAKSGNLAVVRLFLDFSDVNAKDRSGRTPLHFALHPHTGFDEFLPEKISGDLAELLLDTERGDLNLDIVKALLGSSARVNDNDHEGRTPLHNGVIWQNSAAVELLLDNGADPNCQDDSGSTALHLAVLRCDQSIIRTLLDKGANGFLLNNSGKTPIISASEADMSGSVTILQEHGICS